MSTLYHTYDPNNENRVFAGFYTKRPTLAIDHVANGQIDPRYDKINDCIYEGADQETIIEHKRPLIEQIDETYTNRISDLLKKPMEKHFAEQMPIPEWVLEERNRLREECNQKIAELGVDVNSYRKSKRETILILKE